jgi:hypothetical protein
METKITAEAAGEAAVAQATEFWKQGLSARKRHSTDPIAKDSGFDNTIHRPDGSDWDWCGMFVAACYFHAGLDRELRSGFWYTDNVRAHFTYGYGSRVPRWAWDAAEGRWRKLRELHEARGSIRRWLERDALQLGDLAALDIRPGDVAVVDTHGDGKAHHIALVERYDAATGVLVTLEGNATGKVPAGIDADGNILEGDANGPSVVRNRRDLELPEKRKRVIGVGRPSAVDFAPGDYKASDLKPSQPPESVRVATAQEETRALGAADPSPAETPTPPTPRKWDLPPEPIPYWLDAAAEVTEETGARPAPRGPFVVAALEACLAQGCSAMQAAGITANSINETGWGRYYTAFNCGGWKITAGYVRDFKKANPGKSPRWWRAPGNRSAADPPWCYYRAFESFQGYFAEWIEKFVPQPGTAAGGRYEATGDAFWNGGDWFSHLIAAGYKGPVTKANPVGSIREHDALRVTALRMWAQSKIGAAVDGAWGPASRAALSAWQASHQVKDSAGALDDATLAALADPAGATRDLDLEALAPLDADWPEWALDALSAQPEAAADDALDALVDALGKRPLAARRAFARKLLALLADDA